MKKLIVLACAVVFLFGAIGIAQAHSKWAKCQGNSKDCKIPSKFIDIDGTIKCCACHGRIPGIKSMGCP
jgi:hypothetical protein